MDDAVQSATGPGAILRRAVESHRFPHAVLLHGPNLTAVEELARGVAALLLPDQRADSLEKHPDFFLVRPRNKMRQIGVEPVRDLIRALSHSSNQGGAKVAFLLEADRMNPQASNALLKTLEEPPPDSFLFLLTDRPNDLLDTIRSRTQGFRVPGRLSPLESGAWRDWLEDYRTLLGLLDIPQRSQAEVAEIILRLYGLINRFPGILEDLSSERAALEEARLPEETTSEEIDAVREGVKRGFRSRLLAEAEEATREVALAPADTPGDQRRNARRLARAIPVFESTSGLLNLNLQEVAALEHLFLNVLRIWSRK